MIEHFLLVFGEMVSYLIGGYDVRTMSKGNTCSFELNTLLE